MDQFADGAFGDPVWVQRGLRYPECLEGSVGRETTRKGESAASAAATKVERNAIAAALDAEVDYPDERLAAIVSG